MKTSETKLAGSSFARTAASRLGPLGRAALSLSLLAGSVLSASALTTVSPGDLFVGFRQTGAANSLVANIGSATQFFTPALGGTVTPGSSFNVKFGFVPNTTTEVTNLGADLEDTFGTDWADNNDLGTGVRWAVVGYTDNSLDDTPIIGLTARSLFITKARSNPAVQSATLGSVIHNSFATPFNGFSQGLGGGSYLNQSGTANSTVAYIGAASDANNWNTRIGTNGSFSLGASRRVEQANGGAFTGPTNSVLDLYLAPNVESTLAGTNTYLGSFALNTSGELTFTAVPEPSTYALFAGAGVFLLALRRRAVSQPSQK